VAKGELAGYMDFGALSRVDLLRCGSQRLSDERLPKASSLLTEPNLLGK